MMDPSPFAHVADTIRIAVTPVFLLSGLAGILAVVTSRLARIIARARELGGAKDDLSDEERAELLIIARRVRLINVSILCSVLSALAVCLVIALLFVSSLVTLPIGISVALTFIVSMALLMAALIGFIAEIRLALGLIYTRPLTPS
jgi:hypothetical protein